MNSRLHPFVVPTGLAFCVVAVMAFAASADGPYLNGPYMPQKTFHGYYPTIWRTWPQGWQAPVARPHRPAATAIERLPTPAPMPPTDDLAPLPPDDQTPGLPPGTEPGDELPPDLPPQLPMPPGLEETVPEPTDPESPLTEPEPTEPAETPPFDPLPEPRIPTPDMPDDDGTVPELPPGFDPPTLEETDPEMEPTPEAPAEDLPPGFEPPSLDEAEMETLPEAPSDDLPPGFEPPSFDEPDDGAPAETPNTDEAVPDGTMRQYPARRVAQGWESSTGGVNSGSERIPVGRGTVPNSGSQPLTPGRFTPGPEPLLIGPSGAAGRPAAPRQQQLPPQSSQGGGNPLRYGVVDPTHRDAQVAVALHENSSATEGAQVARTSATWTAPAVAETPATSRRNPLRRSSTHSRESGRGYYNPLR